MKIKQVKGIEKLNEKFPGYDIVVYDENKFDVKNNQNVIIMKGHVDGYGKIRITE